MSDFDNVPLVLSRSSVMAGLCLLVPVPFLDEWLAMRVRKHMVASVTRLRARRFAPEDLAPLYRGPQKGCVMTVLSIAVALVSKPIKKALRTVFFVFAIRTAANTVAETLLLGRALDRHLELGEFPDEVTAEERGREARAMQVVFADQVAHTDLQLLRHAITSAFSGLGRLLRKARRVVTRLFRRGPPPGEVHDPDVDAATARLDEALDDSQVQGFLEDFDRRLDEALDLELTRAPLV